MYSQTQEFTARFEKIRSRDVQPDTRITARIKYQDWCQVVSRLLRFQLCYSTHHAVLHTLELHHINPVPGLLQNDLSGVHRIDMGSLRSVIRKCNSSRALLVLIWLRVLISHSVSTNQAHSWWQFRTTCGAKVAHEVARHRQRSAVADADKKAADADAGIVPPHAVDCSIHHRPRRFWPTRPY